MNDVNNTRQMRVRWELQGKILELLADFKSVEEPDYKKLKPEDIIYVLSTIIQRKTT